jgi:hypothetical protein
VTVNVIGSEASWAVAMVRLPCRACRTCNPLPTRAVDNPADEVGKVVVVGLTAVGAALEVSTSADDELLEEEADAELARASTSMANTVISYSDGSKPVMSQCSLSSATCQLKYKRTHSEVPQAVSVSTVSSFKTGLAEAEAEAEETAADEVAMAEDLEATTDATTCEIGVRPVVAETVD